MSYQQLTELSQCVGKTICKIVHCQWHNLAIVFQDSYILLNGHTEMEFGDGEWQDMKVSRQEPSIYDILAMGVIDDAEFQRRKAEASEKHAESMREHDLRQLRALMAKYPEEVGVPA